MDLGSVVAGGGAGGLILACAYAFRQLTDWWQRRSAEQRGDKASAVTNSTTASELILAALRDAQKREAVLSKEVEALRGENTALFNSIRKQRQDHDRQMVAMREEYESEIAELRKQVEEFSDRLAELQDRFRPDGS